jgi:ribonuclease HIII
MTQKNSFTYPLDAAQQKRLTAVFRDGNYLPLETPPHAKIAVEANDCRIVLYKSGKCLIQGRGAHDFVLFTMEPLVLQSVELGYETELAPEMATAHFGVDESGKGDFFGPLVVASAYVDETLYEAMRKMDVKDSKKITSDKKALGLGSELRKLLGPRHTIIKIGPQAYNRLYSKMRNVNTLLAWAHARAIENMLERVPDCPRAVADQFGNERLIRNALMKKGRSIQLEQRHKAESDMAVAAASILAREGFLQALAVMSREYEMEIPKGASAAVREAAVELVRRRGPAILLQSAKCHFRTTDAVLRESGSDRSALGPEGAAVSAPYKGRFRAS